MTARVQWYYDNTTFSKRLQQEQRGFVLFRKMLHSGSDQSSWYIVAHESSGVSTRKLTSISRDVPTLTAPLCDSKETARSLSTFSHSCQNARQQDIKRLLTFTYPPSPHRTFLTQTPCFPIWQQAKQWRHRRRNHFAFKMVWIGKID